MGLRTHELTIEELTDCDRCVNPLHIAFFDQNLKCFLTERLDLGLFQSCAVLQLLYPPVNLRAHTNDPTGVRPQLQSCTTTRQALPSRRTRLQRVFRSGQKQVGRCTGAVEDVYALAQLVRGLPSGFGSIGAVVVKVRCRCSRRKLRASHSEAHFGGNETQGMID